MRIGIFGGAFNPVHNGHLKLIEFQIRANQLDKVIIVPTALPPHKSADHLVDAEDRMNMLSLAVRDKNNFETDVTDKLEISDIEFKLKGKSYTYNTLKKLKKVYPSDDFFLLIGSDQFLAFKSWYRYKDILKMASVVAVAREEHEQEKLRNFLLENQDDFLHNCALLIFKPVVVSSSEIREKVKNREDISSLVPEKVKEYIIEKELYIV